MRDGDVLAALVIPEDVTQQLQALQSLQAVEPPTVKVFFNAEDPVKARYVEDTIKSQAQDANAALTKKLTEVALSYLDLIVEGGDISLPLLGGDIEVLGLERSNAIVRAAQAQLPPNSEARRQLDRVIRFSELAQENLDLSDEILNTIGSPIEVDTEIARRRHHAAVVVRGRGRGRDIAHVRDGPARGRHARARARGERVPPARARARLADRPARREGAAGRRVLDPSSGS